MMEEEDDEAGQPTLLPNLSRLLVSHYLREHSHRVVLIKLYRPFVAELVDKARDAGLGCLDVPSFYDADPPPHRHPSCVSVLAPRLRL
jgi:hypothetical protein